MGQVELQYNEFGGTIDNNIGLLTNLWIIDFENTNITGTIPESLGNITGFVLFFLFVTQHIAQRPKIFGLGKKKGFFVLFVNLCVWWGGALL